MLTGVPKVCQWCANGVPKACQWCAMARATIKLSHCAVLHTLSKHSERYQIQSTEYKVRELSQQYPLQSGSTPFKNEIESLKN